MKNEVMNVEVMENENNEVIDEIVPVAEVFDDETSDATLSKKDMVIGGVVLGLAAAGAVALGRGIFKGGKAIIGKIKDKAAKKNVVAAPATEEINEKPVEFTLGSTGIHNVEVVKVADETE